MSTHRQPLQEVIMYTFEQGTVQVLPNAKCKFSDKKFHMSCMPNGNNGWGITKDITETEANEITRDTARGFYFASLDMLGIAVNTK